MSDTGRVEHVRDITEEALSGQPHPPIRLTDLFVDHIKAAIRAGWQGEETVYFETVYDPREGLAIVLAIASPDGDGYLLALPIIHSPRAPTSERIGAFVREGMDALIEKRQSVLDEMGSIKKD